MEVRATIIQKVSVEPLDVMKALLETELNWQHWVFEENGYYYEGWDESAGCHSIERSKVITKEKYDYIKAIQFIISHLQKQNGK